MDASKSTSTSPSSQESLVDVVEFPELVLEVRPSPQLPTGSTVNAIYLFCDIEN